MLLSKLPFCAYFFLKFFLERRILEIQMHAYFLSIVVTGQFLPICQLSPSYHNYQIGEGEGYSNWHSCCITVQCNTHGSQPSLDYTELTDAHDWVVSPSLTWHTTPSSQQAWPKFWVHFALAISWEQGTRFFLFHQLEAWGNKLLMPDFIGLSIANGLKSIP